MKRQVVSNWGASVLSRCDASPDRAGSGDVTHRGELSPRCDLAGHPSPGSPCSAVLSRGMPRAVDTIAASVDGGHDGSWARLDRRSALAVARVLETLRGRPQRLRADSVGNQEVAAMPKVEVDGLTINYDVQGRVSRCC